MTRPISDVEKLDTVSASESEDVPVAKPTPPPVDELAGLKKAVSSERKRADAAEKLLKDKEREALPELEKLREDAKDLSTQISDLSLENRRLKIGVVELKLPWSIAKRLTGATDEDMREDAKDLPAYQEAASSDTASSTKKLLPNDSAKKAPSPGTPKPSVDDLIRQAFKI